MIGLLFHKSFFISRNSFFPHSIRKCIRHNIQNLLPGFLPWVSIHQRKTSSIWLGSQGVWWRFWQCNCWWCNYNLAHAASFFFYHYVLGHLLTGEVFVYNFPSLTQKKYDYKMVKQCLPLSPFFKCIYALLSINLTL